MISVIICSRGLEYRKAVVENVATTIGVPYEIVAIDNSQGQYGICQAYNIGAAKAQYPLLCFMHEDIEFRTTDWGKIVKRILLDNSIGAIGATGGKWLANAPGTWWSCGNRYLSSNIVDQGKQQEYSWHTYSNPENKPLVDVAAVDGMWICVRMDVWAKHPFDAATFPGFHFYDVDFCASMLLHYRVCVTLEICIAHFSLGSYNDSWYNYADVFYQKHTHQLPLGTPQISAKHLQQQEYAMCKEFLQQLIVKKFSAAMGFKYLLRCLKMEPFNRHTWWLIRHYVKLVWQTNLLATTHRK